MTKKETMLLAVYGSLRKGLRNHFYLSKSEFVGQYDTDHSYSLIDLGSFPGLLKEGGTSVRMEVYKIDKETLKNIDRLEGYTGKKYNSNLYDRETIKTPFGDAYTYFYNNDSSDAMRLVTSGDWTDYHKISEITN